jgi:hypothetical protein
MDSFTVLLRFRETLNIACHMSEEWKYMAIVDSVSLDLFHILTFILSQADEVIITCA